ncbi:MAG: ABC transporter ATP-binding protein [Acidimicrobiales bacterium]
MLLATGVTKSYGDVRALKGVDLAVEAGQIVALLGRNGAGKTTLLSVIAGLLAADGGRVELDGIDALADVDAAAKLIGIAPQETGIYPVLTVRENLEFFADLAGVGRKQRSERAGSVAERLGLTELLDRKGNQLSGGEARRLHTACALVHQPKLLMLDEPTVGADVATRQQLIEAVREMAAEGAAVLYTTHYLPEVEALGADIVIIDDGEILARGQRSELIAAHHLGGLRFTVQGELEGALLAGLEVASARSDDDGKTFEYLIGGDVDMPMLLARFGSSADRLISVERNLPDLESVFLAVTGRELTEEESTL